MNQIYDKINQVFENEDKETAVLFILEKLKNKELDIIELYTELLTPIINEIKCDEEEKHICIWKEHIRTAIARTVVECCYPYVIQKRAELNYAEAGTAVILCPPEEYHDLGARMVSDFFTICGFKAIFVGSNTPFNDFYNAIDLIKPEYVVISVSNYYNLVVTKKIIEKIKSAMHPPVKIVVGGNAFRSNPEKYKTVGADYYAHTFKDIESIVNSGVIL